MIIAFSGIDGSGKTTYAKFAAGHIQSKNLKARYRHNVRDSFYHLILHNVIGGVSESSRASIEAALRSKGNLVYFSIAGFVKKVLLLTDLVCFNIRYGGYKGARAKTLACDRYFYDEIVQMKYLGLARDKFLRFYKSLIIKPDILFFVKSDPTIAYERKREYNEDYFMKKAGLYSDMYMTIPHVGIQDSDLKSNEQAIRADIDRVLG